MRVCGVIGVAVFEGGKVKDEMLLNHGYQAMLELTIREAGVELEARERKSLIALESGEDALYMHEILSVSEDSMTARRFLRWEQN